ATFRQARRRTAPTTARRTRRAGRIGSTTTSCSVRTGTPPPALLSGDCCGRRAAIPLRSVLALPPAAPRRRRATTAKKLGGAPAARLGAQGRGDPEVARPRELETGRCHPDHGVALAVQGEALADDPGVAAEPALPEAVGEDSDVAVGRAVLVWPEGPPEER